MSSPSPTSPPAPYSFAACTPSSRHMATIALCRGCYSSIGEAYIFILRAGAARTARVPTHRCASPYILEARLSRA